MVLKTSRVMPLEERQLTALQSIGARVLERSCSTEDEVIAHGQGADGLIVVSEPISARVIAQLGRCRVIARFGVGVDTIDVEAATAAGIQVTNVPGASAEEVSDHTLAMLLALARRLPAFDAAVREGIWSYRAAGTGVHRLRTQVVGVVGLGRIGRTVASKAALIGLTVIAYDPHASAKAFAAASATSVGLGELLGRSDYVSIHAPLTAESRNLIGARELALMKPSAYLINVARGEIIDQEALFGALRSRSIAGAGLDVLAQEPPDPDDPLLALPNVLLSPHAAHYSEESLEEVRQTAVDDVVRVLAGQPPRHPVNF